MDTLGERLGAKLREWKPETAAQVRECAAQITAVADQDALDLLRSHAMMLHGAGPACPVWNSAMTTRTQLDLAAILGRAATVVNEVIAGGRSMMPETAQGLADAFGTSARQTRRGEEGRFVCGWIPG